MAVKKAPPHLLLHNIISALSYWGTSTRLMLAAFLILVATLARYVGDSSGTPFSYGAQYVYMILVLGVLDAGYVTIGRLFPMSSKLVDRIIICLLMSVLTFWLVAPNFLINGEVYELNLKLLFLIVLFSLALRSVLGGVFSSDHKKK